MSGKGASPPDSLAWQIGKTAASIKFYKDAEEYIQKVLRRRCGSYETYKEMEKAARLIEAMCGIISGKFVLTEFTTPEEYLKQQNT